MEAVKTADGKLEVTIQEVVPTQKTVIYDYDFLVRQKEAITKDMESYSIARQKELDEVNGLLSTCDRLDIKSTGTLLGALPQ